MAENGIHAPKITTTAAAWWRHPLLPAPPPITMPISAASIAITAVIMAIIPDMIGIGPIDPQSIVEDPGPIPVRRGIEIWLRTIIIS